jgi:hypothetical protein
LEIDPLEQFFAMSNEIVKNSNNSKQTSKWYIAIRRNVIRYLKKLVKVHDFSDATFYLALSYADQIFGGFNEMSENRLDLITISCFLIAGK